MMTPLDITVSQTAGGAVVRIVGEIDLGARNQLRESLDPLTGLVVIDMSAVTFIDSVGIAVIAAQHERLTKSGGMLRLEAPMRPVRRALEMVGFDDLIID
jgi:anti-anti-sigma factor